MQPGGSTFSWLLAHAKSSVIAAMLCRYMADNVGSLPLGLTVRLCETNDSLMALVALLDRRPWEARRAGVLQRFNGMWQPVSAAGQSEVSQQDAQVHISTAALYFILQHGNDTSRELLMNESEHVMFAYAWAEYLRKANRPEDPDPPCLYRCGCFCTICCCPQTAWPSAAYRAERGEKKWPSCGSR